MAIWNKNTQSLRTNNNVLFEAQCISDKDGNIINSFGSAANIEIAAGQVIGYRDVHKFGLVDGTAGATSTVWSLADNALTALYPWDIVPGTLSAVSSSAADTQTIRIEGLDSDYNEVSADLTLTGTVATGTTTQVFHRVHRAYCLTGPTNVGRITIVDTGEARAVIDANMGQTLMALYTVPAGCTAFLSEFRASTSKNQACIVSIYVRQLGGAFRVQSTMSLFQSSSSVGYPVPLAISEKSDIEVRVTGGTNNTISSDFDLILVHNDLLT